MLRSDARTLHQGSRCPEATTMRFQEASSDLKVGSSENYVSAAFAAIAASQRMKHISVCDFYRK